MASHYLTALMSSFHQIPAIHAFRTSSLVVSTVLAEQNFAILQFKALQCPRTTQIAVLIGSETAIHEALTCAERSISSITLTAISQLATLLRRRVTG